MLSRQQMQFFAEQGYLVVPQVVPPAQIAAAREEIQVQLAASPPPAGQPGPFPLFLMPPLPDALVDPLFDSPALQAAEALIAPGKFEAPGHVQIAYTVPPFSHRPGGPHIDGISTPDPDGRPGTFTLLAGIFLTNQQKEDSGNLWVWPGSHRATADYLREHGPDALLSSNPYPPVPLAHPIQVRGAVGDLLLAHYLLGHNIGGNTSEVPRETLYFRLRKERHCERWREAVQDSLLEFEPVREATGGGTQK